LNCYLDRDIDAVMRRTVGRPLVARGGSSLIRPASALAFGILLGVAATLLLGLAANWLSAALEDGAIVFYMFVYTMGLKRRTPRTS
jgi:protoheme IX farnesyltransferase